MNFEKLVTDSNILRAIEDMGYTEATEIQEKAIIEIKTGCDLVGQSQTGTGKTAAFVIPILEKIEQKLRKPQVLILCPTRELCVQVAGEFRKLSKYLHGIKTVAVYGGEPIYKQINTLKGGAHIIVGTPGRLIDHINRKTVKLNDIHTIILDEADEMLKMGFREDIELIVGFTPEGTQRIMFSATMPPAIIEITKKYLNQPQQIKIKSKGLTTSTVIQQYCAVKSKYKKEALYRLLDAKAPERCIVFCNTKRMVDEITDALQERNYWSDKIHGDLKQEIRLNVLQKFNAGIIRILVATDVAARGLDIQNVDLVINLDVPEKEDYYVHRIGRSGRAGKDGESITIASSRDRIKLHAIEQYIKKKIDKIPVPSMQEVNSAKMENFIDNLLASISHEALEQYESVIRRIEAKGYSAEVLAASLLKDALTLHELVEEQDLNDYNFQQVKRSAADRPRARKEGKESRAEKQKKDKIRRSRGQTRVFISVGKINKATVKDILGAVTGECRIKGKDIGAIDMYDKFSFIDIEDKSVDRVIKHLKGKRIKGCKVNVEVAKS